MPESTCRHCFSTVWWVASENRWCAGNNDHSLCRAVSHGRHEADYPTSSWLNAVPRGGRETGETP